MTDKEDEPELIFMPGAFDDFDGTQEELDALVAELQRLASTGELLEQSVEVDFEFEDEDLDIDFTPDPRTLN